MENVIDAIVQALIPLLITALTALAGYIGLKLKVFCNDKTKRAVAETVCKAVEQLYHGLGGEEKKLKVEQNLVEMLREKGIKVTELELDMLIESVVAEFNFSFSGGTSTKAIDTEIVPEPSETLIEEVE